jgi:hypothetical protein
MTERLEKTCISCGADWSAGEFRADCKECGGQHTKPPQETKPETTQKDERSARRYFVQRKQNPLSNSVVAFLDAEDPALVVKTRDWLVACADALWRTWRWMKDHGIAHDGGSPQDWEEYEFYKDTARWALRANMAIAELPLDGHANVRALLRAVEVVFADADWSEPCPARESMARWIDALWRRGASVLTVESWCDAELEKLERSTAH